MPTNKSFRKDGRGDETMCQTKVLQKDFGVKCILKWNKKEDEPRMRNRESGKLFLQQNYTTTNDTVGRTRSNCFAMTPEIRNQSRCYPRLSLTKATWNFKPSPPSLSREKKKNLLLLLFDEEEKEERKEGNEEGWKKTDTKRAEGKNTFSTCLWLRERRR